MMTQTVILELPGELYQKAKRAAQASQRPIEQIVVEWIRPPSDMELAQAVSPVAGFNLENLSDSQLVEIARAKTPQANVRRLQELLNLQRQRSLTESEQRETVVLVEQEDLFTLQRARALFLLKQRDILPSDLTEFLS